MPAKRCCAALSKGGRGRAFRLALASLVLSASVSAPFALCAVALAQGRGKPKPADDDPKEKARVLFRKGATAVDQKSFAEGLEALQEAESLFHAPTHVLYIARAQAGLGKLLEAKASYEKVRDEDLGAKKSDAFVDAQKSAVRELEELEARIPKIVVKVGPSRPDDLVVKMNGQRLDRARLGTPMEVDAGTYTFEARGGDLVAGKVTVSAAERTTVDVKLVLQTEGAPSSSSSTVSSSSEGMPAMKIAGIPLRAIGAAGLATGGILGALHFVRSSSADEKYDSCGKACQTEIESLDKEAATFGNASIGSLAGGAAVLTTGIILFALAPSKKPSDESKPPSATALVLPTPNGIVVTGSFF